MYNVRNERPNVAVLWVLVAAIEFVGFVLHLVGFATNEWTKLGAASIGLWRACADGVCQSRKDDAPDWLKAVEAMASIGIIQGFIALVLVVVVLLSPRHFNLLKSVCVCSTLAGVVVLIGIIIYGAKTDADNLGYSFGLTSAGGSLMLIAGLMLALNVYITSGKPHGNYGVQYPMTGKPMYEPSYPQELRAPPTFSSAAVSFNSKPNMYPDDRMSRVTERPTWNERFDRFEYRSRPFDDPADKNNRYTNFDRRDDRLYQSSHFDRPSYADDRFRREDHVRRYESFRQFPRNDDRLEPPPRFHGRFDQLSRIDDRSDQPRANDRIDRPPRTIERFDRSNDRFYPPLRYDEPTRQSGRFDDLPQRYDRVGESPYRYDRY